MVNLNLHMSIIKISVYFVECRGRLNLQSGMFQRLILPSARSDFSTSSPSSNQCIRILLSHKDSYSLGRPMIVPDGDMLVDEGHEIGVFNEDRQ